MTSWPTWESDPLNPFEAAVREYGAAAQPEPPARQAEPAASAGVQSADWRRRLADNQRDEQLTKLDTPWLDFIPDEFELDDAELARQRELWA